MKTWISSLLCLCLLASACSSQTESERIEEDELAEVVLAEEGSDFQKVTFASEEEQYLYAFDYDQNLMRFLGYPLEGMSENGGAFMLKDGAEIVTSTTRDAALGIEVQAGEHSMFVSTERVEDCFYEYRVLPQSEENLVLRAKSCGDQNEDIASKALDQLIMGLTIDAL